MQLQIELFHRKFGHVIGTTPAISRPELRKKLIAEEAKETCDAIEAGDLPGAIDGICDLLYVAIGTAVEFGVDVEPFFDEVHRTNMLKEGGATRPDGKTLKPPGWQPPRIEEELERQRREGPGMPAAFRYHDDPDIPIWVECGLALAAAEIVLKDIDHGWRKLNPSDLARMAHVVRWALRGLTDGPAGPLPTPTLQALDHDDHLMTWADFVEACRSNSLTDDDGFGELATADGASSIAISPSIACSPTYRIPHWATHVVWYNK